MHLSDYNAVLKYIIHFLTAHPDLKYCRPLGKTREIINRRGLSPQILENKSIKVLTKSDFVKYMHYTPMHWDSDQNYLVYVFLVMDQVPVMYAKYALNKNTLKVFFIGWHKSKNPKDDRFLLL